MTNVWDEIFTSESFCSDLNPRRFVTENIKSIPASAGPVLDVGCGCGRHLVYLAAHGYRVYGIDLSDVALAKAEENLRRFGLSAVLQRAPMWEIPFGGVPFAAALAINVLNHGTLDEIARAVRAILQRLLPGGVFLLTLLTTNDYRACGRQVDGHTYICDRGPEKGVLHTVFDKPSAGALLADGVAIEDFTVASGQIDLPGSQKAHQEFFRIRGVRR